MSHRTLASIATYPSERPELRPPLPAGHPVSWGALTRGTVLDGEAWPGAPMTRTTPTAPKPSDRSCAA
jgi:hypothetical protein